MSKKLLSTLIASLFAAAPALGQSADDPMRVQGTATIGGIHNNSSASDTAKLDEYQDLGNGALSNVGVQGRNSTTWFQGYGENFGRSDQYMFLRGGVYDVFKAGAYLNDIPHTFSSAAYTPYTGNGGNLLTATFPLAALPTNPPTAGWNSFRLGYDRRDVGGYGEWQKNSPWYFRVDGNQVSFSGTRPGAAANGTSPGNGYVDLAFPQEYKTSNWGVEGGYQSSKATLRRALGLQQVRQLESRRCGGPTRTSARRRANDQQPARHDVPRAVQRIQQVHGLRQLPRPAVAVGDLRALHVGEDDERHGAGHYGAQHHAIYANTLPQRAQLQRREHQPVVGAGLDGDTRRGLRHARLLLLDEAQEQFGPRRVRPRADDAARVRPGLRLLHAGHRDPDHHRPATATARTTTTPRTTSASTRGGNSRAASAWASAGTTTTSNRSASTTTSRTGTSCGPSTRTRCSTRCPPA